MNKRFLNKIVDQIIRETQMVYPTINELGYVNFPFSRMYGSHDTLIKKNWTILETLGFFSPLPSSLFKQHLEEIYSLNHWGDPYNEQLNYLWDKYVEEFMNKLRKGINIVDTPDNDIPQRWVGQLDESFKKESGISFLIKVVDQLITETEIRGNRAWGTWALNNHLTPSFWQFLLYHCRNVYGLNDDELMWVEDYYRERLDSKLRNNLSESKEINLKDSKFLQKVLKYLIDNTKVGRYEKLPDIDFHYDGYIIVPIGSGFRFDVYNETIQGDGDFIKEWWEEMKEIYSLKNEEVIPLLDEYKDYLWGLVNKISSKEDINESKSLNSNFLNKLLDHIKSETKFEKRIKTINNSGRPIYAGSYVRLPFFPEDWYRGLDDMYITDFIHWIHTTLSINDTSEIEYLWKRYKEWVNKKCNE